MTDLPLTGGCGCGGVRFEISKPLLGAGYCHCTRCQRRSGTAAAVSAAIEPGTLTVVQGEDLLGEWRPEGGFPKIFCTACGSALWSRNPSDPDALGVRMGAFDGDPGVRPSFHQHVGTAVVWEALPDDGLPRYEGPRPS